MRSRLTHASATHPLHRRTPIPLIVTCSPVVAATRSRGDRPLNAFGEEQRVARLWIAIRLAGIQLIDGNVSEPPAVNRREA
jgi:hypothetical protein